MYESVKGKCPACGGSLFLGEGGYVTCSFIGCPNPSAPSELLGAISGKINEDLVRQIVREELEKRPQHIITINAGKRTKIEDVTKEIKDALRTQPMPTRPNPTVPERRG